MVRARRNILALTAIVTFLCVLTVLAVAPPTRANDGSLGRVGESVRPIGNDTVTMVAEDIRIEAQSRVSRVHCRFTFRNDGPATKVLMGFPELPPPEEDFFGDNSIHGFTAAADGQPLEVIRRSGIAAPDGSADLPGGSGAMPAFPFWWTFEVDFAADQQRVVENTYEVSNAGVSNGEASVGYTLVTGRTWAGRIGNITVTVVPQGWSVADLVAAQPGNYDVDAAGNMVWRWTDVDPHGDIHVRLNDTSLPAEPPLPARVLRERAIAAAGAGKPTGKPSAALLELLAEADARSTQFPSDSRQAYFHEADIGVARLTAALAGRARDPREQRPPRITTVKFVVPPKTDGSSRFSNSWEMTVGISDPGEDLAGYSIRVWYLNVDKQPVTVWQTARRDWLDPRQCTDRALVAVSDSIKQVFYRVSAQDFVGESVDTGEVGLYVQPDGTLAASPPPTGPNSGAPQPGGVPSVSPPPAVGHWFLLGGFALLAAVAGGALLVHRGVIARRPR